MSTRVVLWSSAVARAACAARLREVEGVDLVVVDNEKDAAAAVLEADVLAAHVFLYTPPVAQAVREAKRLKMIQLLTVGYDRLAKEKIPPGLVISTAGDSVSNAAAEHAVTLMLSLLRRIPDALADQARQRWDSSLMERMTSLDTKVVAVIGFGAIGRGIGRLARAFGSTVIGVSRSGKPESDADEVHAIGALDAVLPRADAVALALPLTAETRGLLDGRRIALMKDGAILVNVARGPVVDSTALAAALTSGKLAGAGLDVTDPEPPPKDHLLWHAPNLILTPHVAVAGAQPRLAAHAAANIARFMRGETPRFLVRL